MNLPTNHPYAAAQQLVEAETEAICRGDACPRCHAAWEGRFVSMGRVERTLDHAPDCGHLFDAVLVDEAILELELAE